ncbi:MAG: ATP-binding cassette domain-containing protein, partial [Bacillota bacterium]
DEPTSVLAPAQVEQLFRLVRRFAVEGRAVVFITHKLEEVKAVTDRVTVLRDGRVIGTINTGDASPSQLAHMMVGREVFLDRRARSGTKDKRPVLVAENVSCLSDRGTPALRNLNLTVNSGEIVGVAGVDGNGQRELAECISGLRPLTGGRITIDGMVVKDVVRDPSVLGFVPEDRQKTGLITDFSVAENLVLKTFASPPFTRRGFIRWSKILENAASAIKRFRIKVPDAMAPARQLSGGNQQKVVLARELGHEPSLVVASQPTRGLDVGAVEGVHELLLKERARGAAVLFISTELTEVLAVSDRVVVLFKGEIMGEIDPETVTISEIGEMMMGQRQETLTQSSGVRPS